MKMFPQLNSLHLLLTQFSSSQRTKRAWWRAKQTPPLTSLSDYPWGHSFIIIVAQQRRNIWGRGAAVNQIKLLLSSSLTKLEAPLELVNLNESGLSGPPGFRAVQTVHWLFTEINNLTPNVWFPVMKKGPPGAEEEDLQRWRTQKMFSRSTFRIPVIHPGTVLVFLFLFEELI